MPNGQTIIKYGDVRLYRCVHAVEQRANYDSGNSVKSWQFIVRGTGYVHGFAYACKYAEVITEPPLDPPTSAATGMQQIRWRLKPRQDFGLAVGCTSTDYSSGQILLTADAMTSVTNPLTDLQEFGLSGYDVTDGPKCLQFDTVHVSGNNIFKVNFAFEINIVICDDDSLSDGNTNGVVSHRWAATDSIDHNKRTVRTYRGLLEIATSQFCPHWFRYLVVPPLQPGMRRDHMDFTAAEDGRHLQYTITDTEIAFAAPAPATKWEVQHTETTLNNDGLKVVSSVGVDLEGESQCDPGQLILIGLYVVSAKLAGVRPGQPTTGSIFFNDISITVVTGDVNRVHVQASCWRPAVDIGGIGLANRAQGFNTPIEASDLPAFSANYDAALSTDARFGEFTRYEGGISLAGIFRCYLQTSCQSGGGIASHQNGVNDNLFPADYPKTETTLRVVPDLETDAVPYYSDAQNAATYTTHQIESTYRTRSNRVALPIANGPTVNSPDLRDSVAVATIAGSVCERVVRIMSERVGDWPEMPNSETMDGLPDTPGSGYATSYLSGYPPIPQKMLTSALRGRGITKSTGGTDLYHAEWESVYALLRAPTGPEIVKLGINKWQTGNGTISTPALTNSTYR